MTYERWVEEMAREMAMEMFFPSNDERVRISAEKIEDHFCEDEEEA